MSKTAALSTVVGLAAAWLAFTLLVWAYGEAPREVAADLAAGTWGSAYGVGQVLFKATPILFYSAAAYEIDKDQAINSGAQAYLIKPSQPSELCKLVESLIQSHPRYHRAAL